LCTSNDGFIADESGGVDWIPLNKGKEDYGFKDFINKQDAVVMGRKTYDWYMEFDATGDMWPWRREVPVFVLTNRGGMMPGRGRPVKGSMEEVLKRIRESCGPDMKNLYVDGGETIRQFMDAGLLSSLCISKFLGVELGSGVPLMKEKGSDVLSAMKPEYKVYEGGLEQATYNFDTGGKREREGGGRGGEADYSGLGLGEKEIEITEYIWSQCKDVKERRSGLGVLGNRGGGGDEQEGDIYNPNEIIMAPIGIIDTTVKIDPSAWTRAVKCPPPAQTGVIFLVYPHITRRQSGLPPSMRRSGYIDPWLERQNGERQRLQKRAAQAAANRASMGVFGSLFGGAGGGGGGGELGRLPTLEERKRYMVEGVMRKSLQALGMLHKLDVAHRSLGADSIVLTSENAEEDLRNFGAEVSSLYGCNVDALRIVFTDLGFAGKISESYRDAEFCSRASGYGLKLSGSSSIGLTSFAIAEDLHALGVVFLDILFNGVLTKAGAAGGSIICMWTFLREM
ncbi:hypothetical protein TL16_g12738, partial [Triparma laevis f. inornata]